MVMPMVGRPPQHTFLCGCHCEERQEKLEYPAGLIRAMGKVAVISSRDGNHSQIIAADSQHDPFPSYPGLNGPEAHQMDAQKWDDVPMLTKTLPEAGNGGTVGMMGSFIHAEIVALLVQTTHAHNRRPLVATILRKPLPGSPRLRLYQVLLCVAPLRPQFLQHVDGEVDLFHGPGIVDGGVVHQRPMARTIFVTSTGSAKPLRFFARMVCCGYVSSAGIL